MRTRGIVAAVLVMTLAACGSSVDDTRAPTTTDATASRAAADRRGSGELRGATFVRPPLVAVLLSKNVHGLPPEQGSYTVYARLNRDLPQAPDGGFRAEFRVEAARPFGDPLHRIDKRRRHCFAQPMGFRIASSPSRVGALVHVELVTHDAHGTTTGTLAATVRLIAQPVYGPHDYFTDPVPRDIGCGTAHPGGS